MNPVLQFAQELYELDKAYLYSAYRCVTFQEDGSPDVENGSADIVNFYQRLYGFISSIYMVPAAATFTFFAVPVGLMSGVVGSGIEVAWRCVYGCYDTYRSIEDAKRQRIEDMLQQHLKELEAASDVYSTPMLGRK